MLDKSHILDELAFLNDKDFGKPITEEELRQLIPGYEQRILNAVLKKIKEHSGSENIIEVDQSEDA